MAIETNLSGVNLSEGALLETITKALPILHHLSQWRTELRQSNGLRFLTDAQCEWLEESMVAIDAAVALAEGRTE